MNFFDSYYNVGQTIRSKAARQEYYAAIIEYYYSGGQEPVFKYEQAKTGFEGVRFSLDKSLRNSRNRTKTKAKGNANESGTKTAAVPVSSREEEEEGLSTNVESLEEEERKPLNPFDETEGEGDEYAAFAAQALEAFNEIAGKQELYLSPEAFMALRRIQDSGRTIEDVRAVIETKHAEWQDDDKMRRFIRPKTLFGGNFESYLSEANEQAKEESKYAQYD